MIPDNMGEQQQEAVDNQHQTAAAERQTAEQRIMTAQPVSGVKETLPGPLSDAQQLRQETDQTQAAPLDSEKSMAQRLQWADGYDQAQLGAREIGNAEQDQAFFHYQQGEKACAVVAQESIIQKRTGTDFGEAALAQESEQKGWYSADKGTYPADVGKLLEAHGVPVRRWQDAGLDDLQQQIAQGKDAIVGVQASTLWGDNSIPPGTGHVIWVTGMEPDNAGHPIAIIANDSGRADGAGIHYPINTFLRAWAPMGNLMVTAG
ncbi:MAG: hypothetical protein WCF84_14115 [Anaerolineae bacterium]